MMTAVMIMTGFLAELIVDLLSEYVCNQNDISIIFSGLLVYPEHTLDWQNIVAASTRVKLGLNTTCTWTVI